MAGYRIARPVVGSRGRLKAKALPAGDAQRSTVSEVHEEGSTMRVARWMLMALVGLLVVGCTSPAPLPQTATVTAARAATATPTAEPTVSATPMPAPTPTAIHKRRLITLEAEDLSLNYSQELYWNEEGFAREYDVYSADKARYVEGIVEGFSEEFLKPSNLQATGWRVSFISEYELETDKATSLALIRCKIDGAASGTLERPYFRSEWLLRSLLEKGVDLYDFEYTPDKTTLAYEGETDHASITIILRFPKPVGHCHYHIWYEVTERE